MQIDKRMVGLAIVSIILSTLIMLTVARERIDEPIAILKNDYPRILEESRKATFSFALVARKKFENLQLRFSILSQKNLKFNEMIDPRKEYNATDDPEEVLDNIVKLSWLKNESASIGIEPEKFNYTFRFEDTDCRMVIYDYGCVLESLSSQNLILELPLIYAGIIDENGEGYYLAGESDFFFSPEENIVSLSTSHNANESSYIPDDKIWEESKLPLSQAPKGGVLDYRSVGKDDTFTVIYTVEADTENLPEGFGSSPSVKKKDISLIQVIRVYLDGEIFDQPIVNIMQGKRS